MEQTTVIAALISGGLAIIAAILGALIATDRLIITDLFRWKRRLPPGFVILISGSSGVGKTTVAWALARKYNIVSVLGTDLVREALRHQVKQSPDVTHGPLLTSSFLAYHHLLDESKEVPTAEKIVEGFRQQSALLVGPVVDIINRVRRKRDPVIIEGVNLVASQVFKQIANDPHSKTLFVNLYLDSEEKHTYRLRERGGRIRKPKTSSTGMCGT